MKLISTSILKVISDKICYTKKDNLTKSVQIWTLFNILYLNKYKKVSKIKFRPKKGEDKFEKIYRFYH